MPAAQLGQTARLAEKRPFSLEHVDSILIGGNRAVSACQFVLKVHYLVFDLEHREADEGDEDEPEHGAGADHAAPLISARPAAQGGAAVRSAARSRAERAR